MKKILLGCLLPVLMEVGGCGPVPEDILLMEFSVLTIGAVLIFFLLLLGRWVAHLTRQKEGKPKPGFFKSLLVIFIAAFVLNAVFFGCSAGIYKILGISNPVGSYETRADLRLDLFAIRYVTIVTGEEHHPIYGGVFHSFIWNYWLAEKAWELPFGKTDPGWFAHLAWNQGLNVLTFFIFIFVGAKWRKGLWIIPPVWLFLSWAMNIMVYRGGGYADLF
jgi:hypothetical protein